MLRIQFGRVPLAWTLLLAAALFGGCRPSSPPSDASPSENESPSSSSSEGQLTYVQIDIGQGDSSLIVSPDGHAMLVDAGPPGQDEKILAVLRKHGVNRLDYVVESHPHADHIGSMKKVIEDGPPVGLFLASGYNHGSTVQRALLQTVRNRVEGKGKLVRRGDRFSLGDGVSFEVLQPQNPLLKNTESDPNNNSVVLRVSYGSVHFLLTGDMEEDERKRLLAGNADLHSDVLKAAHHGSHNGIDPEFLERVNPKYVLISCETGNDYGHPHTETMAALKSTGVNILRTDLQGDLTVRTDGQTITTQTERRATIPLTLTGKETEKRLKGRSGSSRTDEDDKDVDDRPKRNRSIDEPALKKKSDRREKDRDDADEGKVIGNRRTKVYHLEDGNTRLPSPQNRVTFDSEEEARRAGYRPASSR